MSNCGYLLNINGRCWNCGYWVETHLLDPFAPGSPGSIYNYDNNDD